LLDEPGGLLHEHITRFKSLAEIGYDVEIRGWCVSGCTMIMAYVPAERICFDEDASLRFHLPGPAMDKKRNPFPKSPGEDMQGRLETALWMISKYPQNIREWIMARGGPASMTYTDFWILPAEELWEMGYQKCTPKQIIPMTVSKARNPA
jgi:hypothetical protein